VVKSQKDRMELKILLEGCFYPFPLSAYGSRISACPKKRGAWGRSMEVKQKEPSVTEDSERLQWDHLKQHSKTRWASPSVSKCPWWAKGINFLL